ncbi:hypothetical protein Tco_0412502 [Tanacetum coccineum]
MNHNIEEEPTMMAAEQHREFMAAVAIDSDLDFAYRLQLEEAINASHYHKRAFTYSQIPRKSVTEGL